MTSPKDRTKFGIGSLIGGGVNEQIEPKKDTSTVEVISPSSELITSKPKETPKSTPKQSSPKGASKKGQVKDGKKKPAKVGSANEPQKLTSVELTETQYKKLAILAIETDKFQKELIKEGIDLVLKKYGKL